jgi:hypothetical protein
LVKGPSLTRRALDLNITKTTLLTTHMPQTSHLHTSTKSHAVEIDIRGPEGPTGQQLPPPEAFATNTIIVDLIPSSSQQAPQHNQDPQLEIEAGNDQHQDSEEKNQSHHRRGVDIFPSGIQAHQA